MSAVAWVLYGIGDLASRWPWDFGSRLTGWVYVHTMPISARIGVDRGKGPFKEARLERATEGGDGG